MSKTFYYLISWVLTSLIPILLLTSPAIEAIGFWWYGVCGLLGIVSAVIAEVAYDHFEDN